MPANFTGSLAISGSLVLTGSISTTGTITISGSILSASYASNAELLDNLDSTSFVYTSSFNTYSSSMSTRVTNLESTASVLTSASASFSIVSASYSSASSSLSTRTTNLETTASVLTTASASFAVVSSSFAATSGSLSTRVTTIEGSYATTGSNIFVGTQGINNSSNAISFTSTASLYVDGGARITRDLYVSGTSYFNNVTIYGTQSVNYITSSQLNIGTNIITVNTDTPTVRYGGLAVYDSGSTGLTGSILWDSENNHWIYTNPSASTYSGGMLISGPRASARGCEVGTTACSMMMGQGGDHITSSAIFHYGNTTCFYGNSMITSTGVGCFSGAVCSPSFVGGTISGTTIYGSTAICGGSVSGTTGTFSSNAASLTFGANDTAEKYMTVKFSNGDFFVGGTSVQNYIYGAGSRNLALWTNSTQRLVVDGNGVSCFSSAVCAPYISAGDGTQCNHADAPLTIKRGNGFAGLDFKSLRTEGNIGGTRFYDCAGTLQTQLLVEVDGSYNFYNATANNRLKITATGIACFSCQICAPIVSIVNCLGVGTAPGAGYILDVYQPAGATTAYARIKNNRARNAALQLETNCGNFLVGVGVGADLNRFQIYDNNCSADRLVITSAGLVSIGHDSPQSNSTSAVLDIGNGTGGTLNLRDTNTGIASEGFHQIFGGDNRMYLYAGGSGASAYMQFYTNDAERMRITSTGIACFSSNVCVGGNLVVNGATIELNCSNTTATDARINLYTKNAVNGDRASIYTYNLSATTAGCEITYLAFGYCCTNNQGYINMQTKSGGAWCNTMYLINGRVGIGTDNPGTYKLNVNGTGYFVGTGQNLVVDSSTGTSSSYINTVNVGGNLYYGIDSSTGGSFGVGNYAGVLWHSGNYPLVFATNNSPRMFITSAGIACFACQVCVPNIISTGTSGGRYGTFNAPTNGGYITFEAGGTAFGDLGSYCAQYGTGDATTLLLGSRTGYALSLGTNSTERMRITSTGIACFACTVCAPVLNSYNILGRYYTQTTSSGGTSIINTCINVNDFGDGSLWSIAWGGNPNAAGSSYFSSKFGYIGIITGYNGNVVKTISYSQVANFENVGTLCLFPFFWDGTTECTTVCNSYTGCIRFKICGYNSGYPAANQAVFLTKLLG